MATHAKDRRLTEVAQSKTSFAYERLRSDILCGRLLPDQKLKILELADELGVSQGAVREALSRLSAEELVNSRDQRGFAVAALSIADLKALTDLRCEIEAIALRRTVKLGDVEWEARIIAAGHRIKGVPTFAEGSLNPDWMLHHAGFHAALVSGCGNNRLIQLHARLFEQAERYRGLSSKAHTRRAIKDEHQEMLDRALARDADGLIRLAIEHIELTAERIISAFPTG